MTIGTCALDLSDLALHLDPEEMRGRPSKARGVSEPRLILLQAMASMAWADELLDSKQRVILEDLFREEKLDSELVRQWLSGPVPFPAVAELEGLLPESSDRMDLVTQLLHMAVTDRWFHPGELALMRQLGEGFGIDESVLREIDQFLA